MTNPTPLDTDLLDLLVRWEESPTASPDEVCAGRPDLLESFRRRAERLAAVSRACARAGMGAVPRPDIPGFEIGEQVGRGGMGVVYRGRDRTLDRAVAVKLPVGEYCDPAARRRFEREGRTLARLRHPNVVPIYSAGLAGFTPFLVMDYVPGGHLGDWVSVPEPADRVAEAFEQVCRAVEYAHREGVVHRDLKPSNVLIDGHGRPLVSDFGVAHLFADDRPADPTASTAAGGTPAYTAPEHRPPGRVPYTPTADVWSLGMMLHELLTGRRPGGAGGPARPAPAGLLRIARRCLEPSPADRYASAGAVADAVRGWRTARRRRVRRTVAVGLVVLTGLVAFAVAWTRPEARRQRDQAAAIARFEREGELDLLTAGPDGTPLAVKRHRGAATDAHPTAGGFRVATAADAGIVELLPTVPGGAYTLRATVEPLIFNSDRLVFGVGCKLAAFDTAAGEQNVLAGVFVSQGGPWEPGTATLETRWYGSGPGPGNAVARTVRPFSRADRRHTFGRPTVATGRDLWDLTLRSDPAGVTVTWTRRASGESVTLGPLTPADRATVIANAVRLYPDAEPFQQAAADGSGIGVLIGYGTVVVHAITLKSDGSR